MKKMLPVEELARDERFQHVRIEDTVFDPRNIHPDANTNGLSKFNSYADANCYAFGLSIHLYDRHRFDRSGNHRYG